ncbi:MFS transporter [Calidifontibacter sp. DB0510]|uniref:MFS transporter n=1 Tax=Metallococcus carri TaxID=1656884 RepID=A0A967B008_9MICO|nr:MFS transporter [Metallococcus carri]NHN54935.1 MFS transporter [Metallococcus carri]NOP37281.1 MFS transporter [Calidifontibacter sp. DB2511S]
MTLTHQAAARRRIGSAHPWRVPVLVAAVIAAGLAARSPITAVGPLGGRISSAYGLSPAAVGGLTTLTMVVFMLCSPFSTTLGKRFGIEVAVVIGFAAAALGAALRTLPAVGALYLGTVLVAAGLCLPNVLLPMVIRRDFPGSVGTMTAVYTTTMTVGGALGSWTALPITGAWGLHAGLVATGLVALLAAVTWTPFEREHHQPPATAQTTGRSWRTALGWQVSLFFGMQSLLFYSAVAWLVPILGAKGISTTDAATLLSLLTLIGLLPATVVPPLAARAHHQVRIAAFVGVLQIAGALGIVLLSGPALVAAVLLTGLGLGAGMPLGFAFFGLRTRDGHSAGQLAGMAQCVGYGVAALGPIIVGVAHEATGSWTVPSTFFVLVGVGSLVLGMLAGRRRLL